MHYIKSFSPSRSAFDLLAHSKATGVSLMAEKKLSEAKTVEITEMLPNKQGLYFLLLSSFTKVFLGLVILVKNS